MRCNQVSIDIERFGKYVPKSYPAEVQRIHVYCDDFNSIYAALSKAYALAVNELAEYERIGCRTDVYTNEFSSGDYREMHGALIEDKRKYEDDVDLQYYDTDIQLCEDRIWVYENAEKILDVLKSCKDGACLNAELKEAFGLNDYQIRKLSQMRLDMMTREEYEEAKEKLQIRKSSIATEEQRELYRKAEIRKMQNDIVKLRGYLTVAAHYQEFVRIVMEGKSYEEVEAQLKERFGLTREQAKEIKYFSINDFRKKEQEAREKELERLEMQLEYYSSQESER